MTNDAHDCHGSRVDESEKDFLNPPNGDPSTGINEVKTGMTMTATESLMTVATGTRISIEFLITLY